MLDQFSKQHPVLLLTPFPPEGGGGGGVILRSLILPELAEKVHWLNLAEATPASRLPQRLAKFLDGMCVGIGAGRTAAAVERLADGIGAKAIWVVAHGNAVAVAAALGRSGRFPLHLTVHDDPPFGVGRSSRRQRPFVRRIDRLFAQALRRAASIDVISQGMADRYRRRYGVASTVVHRAVPGAIAASPARGRDELTIGVMGSTYDDRCLEALADAISLAARRLGVRGRILAIGGGVGAKLRSHLPPAGPLDIELAGTLSEEEGIARLRECDLLYVNYPFTPRARVLGQTSFPTKLSSYVMSARPLLIHAPPDSTIAPIAQAVPDYARLWASNDPAAGAGVIEAYWHHSEDAAGLREAACQIRGSYFDAEINRRVMFALLDKMVEEA